MKKYRMHFFLMTLVSLALFLGACSDSKSSAGDGAISDGNAASDSVLGDDTGTTNSDGAAVSSDGAVVNSDSTSATSDSWAVTNQPSCNGTVYQCGNGIDDDGDGLADAQDPECAGPCDNDEGSFMTGLSGDNVDCKKQDCFFDGNSGQSEKCEWNIYCDPAEPWTNLTDKCGDPPPQLPDPEAEYCIGLQTQPEQCLNECRGYTPNGCDCFGCCEVYVEGVMHLILLASSPACTVDNLTACAPCTQTTNCVNACGECELCLGKTVEDLPESCFPTVDPDAGVVTQPDAGSTNPWICPSGQSTCVNHSDCAIGSYCNTGCCVLQEIF